CAAGPHVSLRVGFVAISDESDAWRRASSVGDDDHPEIGMSPERAATAAPALALGDVAAGAPDAPMTSASSATTESSDLRLTKDTPPVCFRRAPHGRFPLRPNRTPAIAFDLQRTATDTPLA